MKSPLFISTQNSLLNTLEYFPKNQQNSTFVSKISTESLKQELFELNIFEQSYTQLYENTTYNYCPSLNDIYQEVKFLFVWIYEKMDFNELYQQAKQIIFQTFKNLTNFLIKDSINILALILSLNALKKIMGQLLLKIPTNDMISKKVNKDLLNYIATLTFFVFYCIKQYTERRNQTKNSVKQTEIPTDSITAEENDEELLSYMKVFEMSKQQSENYLNSLDDSLFEESFDMYESKISTSPSSDSSENQINLHEELLGLSKENEQLKLENEELLKQLQSITVNKKQITEKFIGQKEIFI